MSVEPLIGVDIGGTFTDIVLARPGRPNVFGKRLTTPADPTEAVVAGVLEVLDRTGVDPSAVGRVAHATTLATNTILERRGVDVAFVTTVGFRDMLTLGRSARVEEERFDVMFDAPVPPVQPDRCFEVRERVMATGEVLLPFDEADARAVIGAIAASSAEAVAICFINSYCRPDHELRMAALCRELLPGRTVVASAEIWPEMREYERATTAYMSAYVGPVMERYLTDLQSRLAEAGINAPVHVMESSGGVMSADLAAQRAVYTIESGPAAGVMSSLHTGSLLDISDLISFDMGGTTAKAGVVRDGRAEITRSFSVGGSGSFGGSREGSGIPIKAPAIDLAEVGSGGGSIAWVDDGGALRVGPQSAGSTPGPACYGLGGDRPTVTDANLLLGYLDERGFADGDMPLSKDDAEAAVEVVAARLGVTVIEAALAIHRIANANMGAAVHVVTVQRGIDPRSFTMVAMGGAGPMHAARIAERFEIGRVLIPQGCGVASAIGLLTTDMTAERSRTRVGSATVKEMVMIWEELAAAACDDLGLSSMSLATELSVDLRYLGQAHELTVDVLDLPLDEHLIGALEARFHERYGEAYGPSMRGAVEFVGYRARVTQPVARVGGGGVSTPDLPTPADSVAIARRPAVFSAEDGPVAVPVVERRGLGPEPVVGPAVIEETEATTVVPPGWMIRLGEHGVLEMIRIRMKHLFVSND